MRADLHCNLPYYPWIPNYAIGFIKGYLSTEHKFEVRNIYWNLLPSDLVQQYSGLVNSIGKIFDPFHSSDKIVAGVAKHFYGENLNSPSASELETLFRHSLFQYNELESFAHGLKKFIDASIEEKALYDVDIAGFTMKTWQWVLNYYVLLQLKKHNPGIKTVIGGIQSRNQGLEFMRAFKEADIAIWGEGEVSFRELLKRQANPSELNEIPNLIYRRGDELVSTFPLPLSDLADLNQCPFPDHADYFETLERFNLSFKVTVPVQGIRSCWWNRCKFCVEAWGIPYRERTPENIVDEIEYQAQKHNVDQFIFIDEDIGRRSKSEFSHFLDLLVQSSERRKKPYLIVAELSPFRLDEKSIKAMKKIVIESIQVGFEALSDSLLQKIKKTQCLAHNIQALKRAEEQNFHLSGVNIMRNIPPETADDVVESIRNLKFLRFLLGKYKLTIVPFRLEKPSRFFVEMSQEEMEKRWNYSVLWSILKDLDFLSSVDKREFFNFASGLVNSVLWDHFGLLVDQYVSENLSYRWFVYGDGSSLIEEFAKDVLVPRCRYLLTPEETEILTFCDSVKTYFEIKKHFSNLEESDLRKMLLPLKDAGLLYFNDDFKYFFISVVSSKYKLIAQESKLL